MQLLIRSSVRRPLLVISLFIVACVVAAFGALGLEHEDDVLVFLPEDDDDVALFRDVSGRFGSMRVALVGAAVVGDGDVLEPTSVARIDAATRAFAVDPAVSHVTSLTNVTDVVVDLEGATIDRLVDPQEWTKPRSAADDAALRSRVLARELVVGTLVTSDARATVLVVYLASEAKSGEAVARVQAIAERELDGFELHYSGAAFDAEAIYGAARSDVQRLSPLAAILLVAVILLSFRDMIGVVLTFATVGVAEIIVIGIMGFLGERYTVLTSTLPILLLATGSAYAVHVLGRYYLERERLGQIEAMHSAAAIVSRPVAIAAWTTCAAFSAFLIMDVQPMRAFGLEVAAGTLLCWLTAVTLIPAVLALVPRKPAREQLLPLGGALLTAWNFTERHRWFVIGGLLVLAGAAVLPLRHLAVKTEARAFLAEGSPAWQAQEFLEERFGGSRFVQVLVEGDLEQPLALRKVAMIAERASALPGVTGVTAVTDPVALVIDTLGGGRRLPATHKQSVAAYLLLDGAPDLAPLASADHRAALIQVRVRGEAIPVVAALEDWIAMGGANSLPIDREVLIDRIGWLANAAGNEVQRGVVADAVVEAARGLPEPQWQAARAAAVRDFLRGPDSADLPASTRTRVELAIAQGNAIDAVFRAEIRDPDDAAFYAELLARGLEDARHQLALEHAFELLAAATGIDHEDNRTRNRLLPIIEDLLDPVVESGHDTVTARVTGEPALDRALSRSVARNQSRTMALGLAMVLFLLVALFGSLKIALVCIAPAILTAAVLGAAMGILGVQIDLSTAMVGAIMTDTSTDFGMHYLWYLRRERPESIVRTVGPIMIVSNVLVALAFFSFAFGTSPVMHVFGGLSGATCVVSALLTYIIVPALWRWVAPRTRAGPQS